MKSKPEKHKHELSQFLEDTGKVNDGQKPPIINYYAETAKELDKFNQLTAYLRYPYRISNPRLVQFIHLTIAVAVNSYVMWCDSKYESNSEEVSLKDFIKLLVFQLLQNK